MRALVSEALDCIRQAFNGGENAIELPKGKYDPPVCRVDGPTVLTNRTGCWGGSLPFGQTVSRPLDYGPPGGPRGGALARWLRIIYAGAGKRHRPPRRSLPSRE